MNNSRPSEKKLDTGWVRYQISSRASAGDMQWLWYPGFDELQKEDQHDAVTRDEQWTLYHDHSWQAWTGEMPPREVIEKEIAGTEYRIKRLQEKLRSLHAQT